jgi:hypothetical protein
MTCWPPCQPNKWQWIFFDPASVAFEAPSSVCLPRPVEEDGSRCLDAGDYFGDCGGGWRGHERVLIVNVISNILISFITIAGSNPATPAI